MPVNKSSSKGNMTVREAGQKGGERTSATHGRAFYEKIGQKGGRSGRSKIRSIINRAKSTVSREKP